MRAPSPSSGPAHRPLGTRRPALAALSPGPAARAGVLQTGGPARDGGEAGQPRPPSSLTGVLLLMFVSLPDS